MTEDPCAFLPFHHCSRGKTQIASAFAHEQGFLACTVIHICSDSSLCFKELLCHGKLPCFTSTIMENFDGFRMTQFNCVSNQPELKSSSQCHKFWMPLTCNVCAPMLRLNPLNPTLRNEGTMQQFSECCCVPDPLAPSPSHINLHHNGNH